MKKERRMPQIDVAVETKVSTSVRAQQLSAAFDVPPQDRHELEWHIDAPIESNHWNVGLIVGPSGSGKSTILRNVFGESSHVDWGGLSVIDDFDSSHSIDDIASACSAVGFNTIPAWLRPFNVLSNGEQFRVTLARLLLDTQEDETIVIDEFTSVVDRQVAKIGANAVQKWVRKQDRHFIAATCHYDVLDWLQPDWVIDAAKKTFELRSVQPRPKIEVVIRAVGYEYWKIFAPYHYLTASLNKTARCYVAFVDEQPTAFAGVLHRPHPKVKNIMGLSRLVTLPDWQGLGLAFVLSDALGAAYKVIGKRFRTYPAHPALIRSFDRSSKYHLEQRPGFGSQTGVSVTTQSSTSRIGTVGTGEMMKRANVGVTHGPNASIVQAWRHGSRPCAVFEYVGDAFEDRNAARALLSDAHKTTF
jgi:ABC-type lipoprotein export system ATPase subunit